MLLWALGKRDSPTCQELAGDESTRDHSSVMVFVQEGDLVCLFPQHEKERVQQVD